MIDDNYRILGLLAVSILFTGLAFIVFRWPKSRHATFSQHIASRRLSIVYYIVLFSLVLPLLTVFFFKWFMPALDLPIWFGVLIAISSVTQYLCTLIPEIKGWKSSTHRFFAGISAILLAPALALILISEQINALDAVAAGVGVVIMLTIIAIVLVRKGQPQNFLILQLVYFASFFIPILVISYL